MRKNDDRWHFGYDPSKLKEAPDAGAAADLSTDRDLENLVRDIKDVISMVTALNVLTTGYEEDFQDSEQQSEIDKIMTKLQDDLGFVKSCQRALSSTQKLSKEDLNKIAACKNRVTLFREQLQRMKGAANSTQTTYTDVRNKLGTRQEQIARIVQNRQEQKAAAPPPRLIVESRREPSWLMQFAYNCICCCGLLDCFDGNTNSAARTSVDGDAVRRHTTPYYGT